MLDVIPAIDRWLADGSPVALATVINTWGSAPRKVGAHMVINAEGQISGSVSGGCVESAVIEEALSSLAEDQPRKLHYSVTDEESWEVGLACGGQIDIFVQPLDQDAYRFIREQITADQPVAYTTTISGPQAGTVSVSTQTGGKRSPYWLDEHRFVNVVLPRPTLMIVGGANIAVALTQLAHTLDFKTILIDPRKTFGNSERFGEVDQLIQQWPRKAFEALTINEATAITTLTHDPKIDDPALAIALNSPAFYVGALGSKRTHVKRMQRLLEDGLSQEQIERIHGPIGLDIGAVTPEEIALSILAQIVEHYRGTES